MESVTPTRYLELQAADAGKPYIRQTNARNVIDYR
jgi:hypothetical protein